MPTATINKKLKEKTFKREYAAILFVMLAWSIWHDNVAMVEVIIWPILSFVAAAAGLHIFKKMSEPTDEYDG